METREGGQRKRRVSWVLPLNETKANENVKMEGNSKKKKKGGGGEQTPLKGPLRAAL